jgi:hypothetical protein
LRLISVRAEQHLTRVRARRRSIITVARHRAVHAGGVEHAAVVHAHAVGHVVDALVPRVFDHMVRRVVQRHGAVRRPLHRHDRIVVVLVQVRDMRGVLLVLLARLRVVFLLLALSLALHADGHGDAADGDERHGHREDGYERDLAGAEIVRLAANLRLLVHGSLIDVVRRLIACRALKALGTLTLVAVDAVEARRAVLAWR